MAEKKNKNYLSGREIRAIAKANAKRIKELEKFKNRKAEESEFLTEMKDPDNILEIEDLHTFFYTEQGVVKAVNGVSYNVPRHSVVGVVGESGCGKSVTSMSVMRLIQGPSGQIDSGSIRFQAKDYKRDAKGEPVCNADGEFEMEEKIYDIAKMPINEIHRIRGKQVAMIFQEPMTSLNPVFTIGDQLCETFMLHQGMSKKQAEGKALSLLEMVKIPEPAQRMREYPHQLSGGMRQRVMIAMALACLPELLIADEPTTALDVTIQAQVLDLMRDLQKKLGTAIAFITHDLGVVSEMCDRVIVLYCGEMMEEASVDDIFENPKHPYTEGLMATLPKFDQPGHLATIPGTVPPSGKYPKGCVFAPRCKYATEQCHGCKPPVTDLGNGHKVRCFRYAEGGEVNE